MRRSWKKLGLLYAPGEANRHPKLITHAANPLPIHLENDTFRVYFSGRDHRNRSSVGAVDIDIVRHEVIKEHFKPIFEHGPEGSFYADGVSIGNCYSADGVLYMTFMGWQAPENGHWRGDIGRLIVEPDLSLSLEKDEPFLAADNTDPISLSYPWVLRTDAGYSMWYGSTLSWDAGNGEMLHVIRFATSSDGHSWTRHRTAVPFEFGHAQAFSRPTVMNNRDDGLEMWFSYRSGSGEKYRIGYANSKDGTTWKLDLKNSGIDVSVDGWDSEMIEYPFVFDHRDKRYMLYNGNGYGKTGFGLAVLVNE